MTQQNAITRAYLANMTKENAGEFKEVPDDIDKTDEAAISEAFHLIDMKYDNPGTYFRNH